MNQKGFTLIELLVAIAIIGVLASVILTSLSSAREQANVARVKSDLQSIRTAMELLANDTGKRPGGYSTNRCAHSGIARQDGNAIYIDNPHAGLVNAEPGKFPGWNGPYIAEGITDPWGQPYIYDSIYKCNGGENNCTGTESQWFAVIHSGGPNGSSFSQYDSDNIALVICENRTNRN